MPQTNKFKQLLRNFTQFLGREGQEPGRIGVEFALKMNGIEHPFYPEVFDFHYFEPVPVQLLPDAVHGKKSQSIGTGKVTLDGFGGTNPDSRLQGMDIQTGFFQLLPNHMVGSRTSFPEDEFTGWQTGQGQF